MLVVIVMTVILLCERKTAVRLLVPWAGPAGRASVSTLDGSLETEPHRGKSLTKPVVSEATCVAGVKCCECWSQK